MRIRVFAVVGLVLLLPITASATPFIPISGSDIVVATSGDDFATGPFNLGFTFPFFSTNQTQVFMNSNGNLTFVAGTSNFSNSPFPISLGPPMIAPLWDDLFLPPGDMRYSTGTGVFAATWNGVGFFGNGAIVATAQAALFGAGNAYGFAPGSIVFSYGNVGGCTDATVGLNSSNGTTFAVVGDGSLDTAECAALSGQQFLFTPLNERQYSVTDVEAVPEPASLVLLGTGLVGLVRARRRLR